MENQITGILKKAAMEEKASDVFIVAGRRISFRKGDSLRTLGDRIILPPQAEELVREIYALAGRDIGRLINTGDDDFSISIPGITRCRVCAYMQRGSMSAVMRIIAFQLPDPATLHIPPEIIELGNQTSGMVLVTGQAGSGKSTTLACIIDDINHKRESHIITLEDPIEYLHRHEKSIVSQREIAVDTESYVTALRAALRQSPDVILLGEMRDFETISVAMTAAETGHLLLSTLHTIGAASTINRIIDVFPANQQHQIAVQLSTVLKAVVSQQLVTTLDGETIPVFEIMTVTPAIQNMIRENKIYQINGTVYSSKGMRSMDESLNQLVEQGKLTVELARNAAVEPDRIKA